jgi:hypothetical protein
MVDTDTNVKTNKNSLQACPHVIERGMEVGVRQLMAGNTPPTSIQTNHLNSKTLNLQLTQNEQLF